MIHQAAGMTIEIINHIKEIKRVHQALDRYLLEQSLGEYDRKKVSIAVDEILSNIISYAYEDKGRHTIRVNLDCTEDRLTLEFLDDGKQFDPIEFIRNQGERSAEDMDRVGGLGLKLVGRLMNRLAYLREGNQNKLTLVLNYSKNYIDS